jgi:hypothetical protein
MADDILSPRQVLESYEKKFIDALHKSLEKHDRISGGVLFQSVTAITKIYGQKVTLEISMADYWRWVDEGRKKGGKQPPPDAMLKFIRNRGITPSLIKKNKALKKKDRKPINKDAQYRTLAFLIGRSIKKNGIKPTHFATEVMDESKLIADFREELNIAVGRNIQIEIDKEVKKWQ